MSSTLDSWLLSSRFESTAGGLAPTLDEEDDMARGKPRVSRREEEVRRKGTSLEAHGEKRRFKEPRKIERVGELNEEQQQQREKARVV